MTITLADINDTLQEQTDAITEEQIETQERIAELSDSFDTFVTMLKSDEGDDLEAEREANRQNNVAQTLESRGAGGGGGDGLSKVFDVGNLIPFATGLVTGMIKRGIPALIGVLLADELAEQVKKMTGSDLLANVTEFGAMGGAIGFLFGGVKGGILGAAIGAIFSDASRDKIAEVLSDVMGKEIQGTDAVTLITASAATGIALLAPRILSAIMPLLLSPFGLLVTAAGASVTAAFKYFTDDKFRAAADKNLDPLRNKIDELMAGIAEAAKNYLNKVFPDFVTTEDENRRIDQMMKPEDLAAMRAAEADIAAQRPLFDELNRAGQAQIGGPSRLERLKKFAEEQGIDMSRTAEVSSNFLGIGRESTLADANDALRLQQEIGRILGERTAESKATLKRIEAIRRDLEQQLQESDIRPDIGDQAAIQTRIRALEAKLVTATDEGTKNFIRNQLAALRPLSRVAQSTAIDTAFNDYNASQAMAGRGQPTIIDASTQNNGSATTAFVGSGVNSFDMNSPLVQRAMADLHG